MSSVNPTTERRPKEAAPLFCRCCGSPISRLLADLGMHPLDGLLKADQLDRKESYYPLRLFICSSCFLVQLGEVVKPERIVRGYVDLHSTSDSRSEEDERLAQSLIRRLKLTRKHRVIEAASNDGGLLRCFLRENIPALGIEPAGFVAQEAIRRGVPTLIRFFNEETGRDLARDGLRADLLIARNVINTVPNLHDFVRGLKFGLNIGGTVVLEFPNLHVLMKGSRLDAVTHGRYSYLSLSIVEKVLSHHGLNVFDAIALNEHRESLRLYIQHNGSTANTPSPHLAEFRSLENSSFLDSAPFRENFEARIHAVKHMLLSWLIERKESREKVVAYGASSGGCTLLNFCGIGSGLLDYTVDLNPLKQDKYLAGSHLPVLNPGIIEETRPDYILILPRNRKDEIMTGMSRIRAWGGRFVTAVPAIEIFS